MFKKHILFICCFSSGSSDDVHVLQIDFPSLVDVRVIKCGAPSQSGLTEIPVANGIQVPSGTTGQVHEAQGGSKNVVLTSGNGDLNAPIPGKV